MPVTDALTTQRILALMHGLLDDRANLAPEMQARLDESVVEFVAHNPIALSAILHNPPLMAEHPETMRRLLQRAYERALKPKDRQWVANQARLAGHPELFPAAPTAVASMALTKSQRNGLRRLRAMANLHFEGSYRYGIQLRTTALLVGPSGVGKTALVRQLGASLDVPVLKLTYGDWIVGGAKIDPTTLRRVQMAIERHPRLIIHLDELDKFHFSSDAWTRGVMAEIYCLLDRELSGGGSLSSPWKPEHAEKLSRNVFLVGSGTWQDLWTKRKAPSIGFCPGGASADRDMSPRIRHAGVIPDELINRFNADWIMLEPYTVEDFRNIAGQLKLGPAVLDPVAAAASGLNFRAVEAALTADSLRAYLREADPQL
ncbi:MAG: AAA family ATPase [Lacunisphaera sp.]|nr:AAA family ATPase [Lacunisphaera sp.]